MEAMELPLLSPIPIRFLALLSISLPPFTKDSVTRFVLIFNFTFSYVKAIKISTLQSGCLCAFSLLIILVKIQDPSIRESHFRGFWLDRNERILEWLLYERSSIICLQVKIKEQDLSFSFICITFSKLCVCKSVYCALFVTILK